MDWLASFMKLTQCNSHFRLLPTFVMKAPRLTRNSSWLSWPVPHGPAPLSMKHGALLHLRYSLKSQSQSRSIHSCDLFSDPLSRRESEKCRRHGQNQTTRVEHAEGARMKIALRSRKLPLNVES